MASMIYINFNRENIVDFEAQSSMGNALKIHLAVFLYRQNPIGYCVTFSNLMVFICIYSFLQNFDMY
jgi:hypothetical protein